LDWIWYGDLSPAISNPDGTFGVGSKSDYNGDSRVLADIAAAAAVIATLVALIPDTGPRTDEEQRTYDRNLAAMKTTTEEWPCMNSGGYMNAFGSCSH
jgi:hypothetical protein